MKQKIRRLLCLLLAAAVLLTLGGCAARGGAEQKTITVTVVHGDGTQKDVTIRTAADTLSGALEEAALAQGEEGPYGLYILTVDGETADEAQQQWWGLTQDGADVMTGAESVGIADGDHYELTLHTGW